MQELFVHEKSDKMPNYNLNILGKIIDYFNKDNKITEVIFSLQFIHNYLIIL